ncbi:class E sortase [Streptomyces gamaensis]|uniref:Class E sortase n=1 Tax=Streptomyces gamaensis TaxID=1763542 RepID=A0ABW0YT44_9ACTN
MRLRPVLRTLSELCVTAGALIVLFVVYVLYWTGLRADSAMDSEIDHLRDRWAAGPAAAPDRPPQPPQPQQDRQPEQPQQQPPEHQQDQAGPPPAQERPAAPDAPRPEGRAFAVMYVPRFGADWAKPVLEGTGTELLKRGLGHYGHSAAPGAVGNFAVAGHRRTYGDPFKDLPRLREGDAVLLTDGATWFTYRVDGRPYVTRPDDVGVVDPVPAGSPYRDAGRYLTLTTCEPEWGHSKRLVVWAHLETTRPAVRGETGASPG